MYLILTRRLRECYYSYIVHKLNAPFKKCLSISYNRKVNNTMSTTNNKFIIENIQWYQVPYKGNISCIFSRQKPIKYSLRANWAIG